MARAGLVAPDLPVQSLEAQVWRVPSPPYPVPVRTRHCSSSSTAPVARDWGWPRSAAWRSVDPRRAAPPPSRTASCTSGTTGVARRCWPGARESTTSPSCRPSWSSSGPRRSGGPPGLRRRHVQRRLPLGVRGPARPARPGRRRARRLQRHGRLAVGSAGARTGPPPEVPGLPRDGGPLGPLRRRAHRPARPAGGKGRRGGTRPGPDGAWRRRSRTWPPTGRRRRATPRPASAPSRRPAARPAHRTRGRTARRSRRRAAQLAEPRRRPGRAVLYRIEGGGHTWPGGAPNLSARIVGPVARHLDATGILLDFVTGSP
jgi:hypothetical protein